jgi:chaperonin cofactor prefoldin
MKRKDRKNKVPGNVPSEDEQARLQKEIEDTMNEMEGGIDRLRKRFKKMQDQLSSLHKHLHPDEEGEQGHAPDENFWSPDATNDALLA